MPQQINLSTPILLTQKRYFSAQTLVQGLALLLLVGGGLCAYGVWSLNQASAGLQKTLAAQALELQSLQAAMAQSKAGAAAQDGAQDLQARRAALAQREKWLVELQRGLMKPGWGHSSRLQLLAQSIPPQVWVTQLQTDEHQLEVSGFTLEPAALNDWVARLAASPLLQGQQLASVKVEHSSVAAAPVASGTRPMWSFTLLSAVAKAPVATPGSTP